MNNILSDLVKRYANGERLCVLANESGIYRQKIIRAIRKNRIVLRGAKRVSKTTEKKITNEYRLGDKTKTLSKRYGISITYILKILKRNGLQIRPNYEECRIYDLKETFFDNIDNEKKAYILGLLYADGCNTGKRVTLGLTGDGEKNLLDRIGSILYNDNYPLGYWKKTKSWRLTIVNKKLATQLVSLGVVPRKSLILKFPSRSIVRETLLNHFIRGYFDGDGSIMLQRDNTRHIVSFVGTFDFLTELKNILIGKDVFGNIYNASAKSGRLFDLRIQDRKSVDVFCRFIYDNATIWLGRKKEKFTERKLHENYRDSSGRRGRFVKNTPNFQTRSRR